MALLDFGVQEIGMVAIVDAPHFHQFVNVVQEGLRGSGACRADRRRRCARAS